MTNLDAFTDKILIFQTHADKFSHWRKTCMAMYSQDISRILKAISMIKKIDKLKKNNDFLMVIKLLDIYIQSNKK